MITKANEHELSLRPNMRGGDGTAKLYALMPQLPAKLRLFSRIELEPGCSIGYHEHENETELFYFIEGHGRVCDDGIWHDVSAGDAMSTPDGHGHAVENTGDSPLIFVAAIVRD